MALKLVLIPRSQPMPKPRRGILFEWEPLTPMPLASGLAEHMGKLEPRTRKSDGHTQANLDALSNHLRLASRPFNLLGAKRLRKSGVPRGVDRKAYAALHDPTGATRQGMDYLRWQVTCELAIAKAAKTAAEE